VSSPLTACHYPRLMSQREPVYRPEDSRPAKKNRFGLTVERHFVQHLGHRHFQHGIDQGKQDQAEIDQTRHAGRAGQQFSETGTYPGGDGGYETPDQGIAGAVGKGSLAIAKDIEAHQQGAVERTAGRGVSITSAEGILHPVAEQKLITKHLFIAVKDGLVCYVT
jgi:hypothetical protein